MKEITVVKFLEKNKDCLFPNNKYSERQIKNALLALPDKYETAILNFSFRKPQTVQIMSLLPLGIDRFYLGDIGTGLLKYCTLGVFGVLWIKDMVSAKSNCRAYNVQKLMYAVKNPFWTLTEKGRKAKRKASLKSGLKAGVKTIGSVIEGITDVSNGM